MTAGIRRLGPDDAAAYREIRLATLELAQDVFGTRLADEAARPLPYFAAQLVDSVVLGAFIDARIIGVVRISREARAIEAHKAVLGGVFVHPVARGQGIGRALVQEAIMVARGMVEQLTLGVVRHNTHAIRLYEDLGFRTYGIEPRARKIGDGYVDMVLMALPLH